MVTIYVQNSMLIPKFIPFLECFQPFWHLLIPLSILMNTLWFLNISNFLLNIQSSMMAHATFYLLFWPKNKNKRYFIIIFICSPPKILIFLGHFPHFWNCIKPCIAKNTQCDSLCYPPFFL